QDLRSERPVLHPVSSRLAGRLAHLSIRLGRFFTPWPGPALRGNVDPSAWVGQSRALIHVEIVDARQRRVFLVRFRLIPVDGRRNIILQGKVTRSLLEVGWPITPTKRLDSHAQILFEPNRISDMPAIKTETLLAGVQAIRLDHLSQP